MSKEVENRSVEIERTISKTFRKELWAKFIKGITDYKMVNDGDKIAVCISGGKDSFLLAKCFQILKRYSETKFDVVFISMNPGYNEENKEKILVNSKILDIPVEIFETDIFSRVYNIPGEPCYLCARMRRGYLYEEAKRQGCNKIALGHHFNDVIETILMGMLYGSQVQTMMPKLPSTSHPGMELIRPLYYVREEDIIKWREKNNLEFISCGCKIAEKNKNKEIGSKRQEIKKLIESLKENYDIVDQNIFNSVQNVNLDTIISYKKGNEIHSFLDDYEEKIERYIEEEKKNGKVEKNEEEDV